MSFEISSVLISHRPENIPRLFDLIRVKDETVKTCFYFALRNTLVAKDIDQATRIAYGKTRYRVVTLKGELIEMTGAFKIIYIYSFLNQLFKTSGL